MEAPTTVGTVLRTLGGVSRRAPLVDACGRSAVAAGWLVLRFTWEDVMFRPDDVVGVLREAVARRTEVRCPTCLAA